MPQDAPPNGSAPVPAWDRVAGMQALPSAVAGHVCLAGPFLRVPSG